MNALLIVSAIMLVPVIIFAIIALLSPDGEEDENGFHKNKK